MQRLSILSAALCLIGAAAEAQQYTRRAANGSVERSAAATAVAVKVVTPILIDGRDGDDA
jgi:hypothetical protein